MGGEGPRGRNILSFQEVYSKFQNTNIEKDEVSVSKSKVKIKHTKNEPFSQFSNNRKFLTNERSRPQCSNLDRTNQSIAESMKRKVDWGQLDKLSNKRPKLFNSDCVSDYI